MKKIFMPLYCFIKRFIKFAFIGLSVLIALYFLSVFLYIMLIPDIDQDICLDTDVCKKGLTLNDGYYTFLINEKSCEIMNGTWNGEYCHLRKHLRNCDNLFWDTINNKCTEILPDEIVNDPSIIVGQNEEKIKEYLENQALKNN